MRGNILDFSVDEGVGVISGPDEIRYKFTLADWKHKCPVFSGVNVDYVVNAGMATEIYCTDVKALNEKIKEIEVEAASNAKSVELLENNLLIRGLEEKYSGYYRSSDKSMWSGVCAGLAHKTGIPLILVRAVFIYPGFIFLPLYYFSWSKWKELPTDNVHSVGKGEFASKLNSVGSFISIMAGKRPDGTRGAVAYDPAVRAIYSNTVTCKKCYSTLTLSNNYMDHNCNVCKSSISLSYYPEGSIKDIRQSDF